MFEPVRRPSGSGAVGGSFVFGRTGKQFFWCVYFHHAAHFLLICPQSHQLKRHYSPSEELSCSSIICQPYIMSGHSPMLSGIANLQWQALRELAWCLRMNTLSTMQGLKLDPTSAKALFRAGQAHTHLHQSQQAADISSFAIEMHPGHPQLLELLAEAQEALKADETTRAALRTSLANTTWQEQRVQQVNWRAFKQLCWNFCLSSGLRIVSTLFACY